MFKERLGLATRECNGNSGFSKHTSDIDLLLLQAVNYEWTEDDDWGGQLGTLCDYLAEHDYSIVHTGDWAEELATSNVQPHTEIVGSAQPL